MYIINKDLVYQLSTKITELSELQHKLLLDNINNLEDEATEEDKEMVDLALGMR